MDAAPLVAPRADIVAAQDGDREAMGRLWRTYQPQILRFLRSRRCADADDVASQVWIDVGRSFARFDGDGVAFQRWVFTIARHRSIDLIRRDARRREVPLPADEGTVVSLDHRRGADPASSVVGVDGAVELLERLPVPQAEAVLLRIVWDLSVADVAEIMGESEANVRVLAHRGVTRLRRLMGAPPSDGADDSTGDRETCNASRARDVSQT